MHFVSMRLHFLLRIKAYFLVHSLFLFISLLLLGKVSLNSKIILHVLTSCLPLQASSYPGL